MMQQIAEVSPRFKARMAGALFLLSAVTAVFGEVIDRRFEIPSDIIAVSGMIAVTLLLYTIFKPVNSGLSLLATSFNLVGLACGAFRWNPRGIDIPIVLNGLYCFLIGYLIFRSTFLPRILGALTACAGLGWVTYVSPPLAASLSPFNLALATVGEGSLMLWLLIMGVNVQRWRGRANAAEVRPA